MNTNSTLVPVFAGNLDGRPAQLCDARMLHTFLQVRRDFTTWIKGRIRKFGFVDGVDFLVISRSPIRGSGNRGASTDYHLTMDTAKELSMVENNEQGREARRYFIACERELAEKRPYSVSHSETLTKAEGDTLRDMLTNFAKSLPQATQGEVMRQGWSKLKSHFKTDYRHIPASQFTEAVNILSRHMAAWSKADTPALPSPTGIERMLITKDLATGETTLETLKGTALVFRSTGHLMDAIFKRQLGLEVTQNIVSHATFGLNDAASEAFKQIQKPVVANALGAMKEMTAEELHELSTKAFLQLSLKNRERLEQPASKGDRLMDAALSASAHA